MNKNYKNRCHLFVYKKEPKQSAQNQFVGVILKIVPSCSSLSLLQSNCRQTPGFLLASLTKRFRPFRADYFLSHLYLCYKVRVKTRCY